ncbi:hypothetical protein DMC30DRAFT_387717 [Rhodotorula diobovata]|uniref:Uncharacterized protein n=1 Tax=Rhodotorula diobovata TaxID=5288 RepID=A0A5C5G5D3_9BASI|nr:hypothetical protein DMC30DRAFT_387717 [Rhodotorula diobovata]
MTASRASAQDYLALVHQADTLGARARSDLHRFLADTLEYRSRLLEIRDGTLGVERRRKGMHKLVRTVAMDWLQEEGAGMGVGEAYHE